MTSNAAHRFDESWLHVALGEPVTIASSTIIGEGVGLLATLTRVALADGRRFVIKEPSTDPRSRAIAHQFGYYAREAGAYDHLLRGAGLATPTCRAIVDSPTGPVLVLEDLVDHAAADQLAGATPPQAFAVAELAADLHAHFWNDPRLAMCAWLPGPTDPVIESFGHLFDLTWPRFTELVAGDVPPEHLATAEAAVARFGSVCRHFADAPRTLLHGDLRLDNVVFDAAGHPAMLDWQLAQWGRGAYDLAFFVSGSIEDTVLAAIERDLVGGYHRRLVTNGVADYDLATCWHDYLGGLIMNLPNPVTALVAVPPGNERGARMLRTNARRALATVARHAVSLSSW